MRQAPALDAVVDGDSVDATVPLAHVPVPVPGLAQVVAVERRARGEDVAYEEILESMRIRDRIDSGRDLAPLRAAEDAVMIDSTRLSIEQVLDEVVELLEEQPS